MEKKKRIILVSVVLICVVMLVSALAFVLTRDKQEKPNDEQLETLGDGPVRDITDGYFPAEVLNSIGKPVYNNDLKNKTPVQELRDTGLRYTFGSTNALKSVYVKNITMEAKDFDTMTVRLRSLTEEEFTRFRLYLLTDQGGDLVSGQLVDTAGKNADLITVSEPDEDGWITVTIVVKGLEEWTSATTIKGFNFGWMNKGTDQEVDEIKFSWEDAKLKDEVVYDWAEGFFPADVLSEIAVPVYNNKETTTENIHLRTELLSTGLRYRFNQLHITGLKSMWVQDLELDTKKFDTMTVKIRSIDKEEYSRWRLYLVSDQEGELKSDPVADSANAPGLFQVSKADEDGWLLVNIDLTKLTRWKNSQTIKAFAFGFVNAGPNHEISYVKFHKTGQWTSNAPKIVTDGKFPAKVLYANGYPVYDKKVTTTRFNGEELQKTGVKYTWAGSYVTGLKSVYVENISLDTERFDTMTIRLRALDKGKFTRYRLYLLTDTTGDLSDNTLGMVINSEGSGENITVSEADSNGWITVKIDVGNIALWKNSNKVVGFSFGFVNTGFVQEIAEINFTKENTGANTIVVPEKIVTDGKFPAEVLFANGKPVWNKDEASTDKLGEELTSTGVVYDYTGKKASSLKSVYVESMELNPKEFDTMKVKIRSLDDNDFTLWRLYLLTDKGGSLSDNTTGMVVNTDKADKLVTVSEPDGEGWITVTIDVGSIDLWKNAELIKGLSFGYVNEGPKQEIAEIMFTKEKASDSDTDQEPQPEPTVVTDGRFPAEILFANGKPVWNNDTTETDKLGEELATTGVVYDYTNAKRAGSLKSVYVESMELNPADFNTMTVKIRALDDKDFTVWRLYLLTDKGGSLSDNNTGRVVNNAGVNDELVTISEPDNNGWITVTIDVGSIDLWKNAGTIKGFSFGYVNEGAKQEIAEIMFTKEKASDSDTDQEPQPEPTVVTDGRFPAEILFANGKPVWNNDTTSTDKLGEELATTGVVYDYTNAERAGSLKSVYVESMELNPADFNTMTVKIRALDDKDFTVWRLYLLTDKGGSLSDNNTGRVVNNAGVNDELVTISEPDSNGWITVTIDVGSIDLWKNAGTIKGFSFGYVNTGAKQEIAEIMFTKETESDQTPDPEPETGLTEEEKMYIANGVFDANILYVAGQPLWNNNVDDTASTEELTGGNIKYTFEEGLALKSIYVNGIEMTPSEFGKMVVRVRSLTTDEFERFRLYLLTDKGGSLTESPIIDTGKDINVDKITIGEKDADGWIDVTIDLSGLDAWTQATIVQGFSFGYVNEGSQQEVESIRFYKTSGTFTKSAIYLLGKPVWDNNKTEHTISPSENLLETGVKYDFTGLKTSSLKSLWLENLAIDTEKCDTMTVKIRTLDNKAFTRWRLYLLTDNGGSISDNTTGMVVDTKNLNEDLVTISDPDSEGWITVTIKVGSIDLWKDSSTIEGINFGYVNQGNIQEIGEISFTKADISLASKTLGVFSGVGIIGMISPKLLSMIRKKKR